MNKVFLTGNLTRDPELATTNNGIAYCKFGIAVQRTYSGEDKEVDFFNITAWRTLAENCHKYLKKGSKAAIFGRLQNDTFEAKDGVRRSVVNVIAEDVEFLSPKAQAEKSPTSNSPVRIDDLATVNDNLPF